MLARSVDYSLVNQRLRMNRNRPQNLIVKLFKGLPPGRAARGDAFVLTTSFTTYMTRPVVEGTMKAVGKVVNSNRSQWIAETVLYNDEGQEIARGNGIFVRSKIRLSTIPVNAEEHAGGGAG